MFIIPWFLVSWIDSIAWWLFGLQIMVTAQGGSGFTAEGSALIACTSYDRNPARYAEAAQARLSRRRMDPGVSLTERGRSRVSNSHTRILA